MRSFISAISLQLLALSQIVHAETHALPVLEIIVKHTTHEVRLDAEHPSPEWKTASPIRLSSDWQGNHPDPGRETTVRVLWSKATLFLRFDCRYRELFLFEDSDANGRRDQLWERDVAEAFLQPDPSPERRYKEFEISPNG